MSLQLNRCQFAGNLTRDPQFRQLANERSVASFGIAINRRWRDSAGELCEETTFVDCEAWGKTADFVAGYFGKGSAVYVEGRMRLETWTSQAGEKRSRLKLVVERVDFVANKSPKAEAAGEAAAAPAASEPPPAPTPPAAGPGDEPPFGWLLPFLAVGALATGASGCASREERAAWRPMPAQPLPALPGQSAAFAADWPAAPAGRARVVVYRPGDAYDLAPLTLEERAELAVIKARWAP